MPIEKRDSGIDSGDSSTSEDSPSPRKSDMIEDDCWTDKKSETKSKYIHNKNEVTKTGGATADLKEITPMDDRILALIGLDAVEGLAVPESCSFQQHPSGRHEDEEYIVVMDETLRERLLGLTEMFPESLRNFTSAVVYGSLSGVKSLYSFTRSASWVFFTTTTILVAPVLFDVERINLEEVLRQQRQVMDETLRERLLGLTEMFPESLRNFTSAVVYGSLSGVKSLYSFTRSASWVFFTTTTILVAPVLFDVERINLEEVLRQQRQILVGPSATVCW